MALQLFQSLPVVDPKCVNKLYAVNREDLPPAVTKLPKCEACGQPVANFALCTCYYPGPNGDDNNRNFFCACFEFIPQNFLGYIQSPPLYIQVRGATVAAEYLPPGAVFCWQNGAFFNSSTFVTSSVHTGLISTQYYIICDRATPSIVTLRWDVTNSDLAFQAFANYQFSNFSCVDSGATLDLVSTQVIILASSGGSNPPVGNYAPGWTTASPVLIVPLFYSLAFSTSCSGVPCP